MLDLPVMIAVIICLLIAWERSRREDEDTEEWDEEGTHDEPSEADRSGRGRAAEGMSFQACEEANDPELVRTK